MWLLVLCRLVGVVDRRQSASAAFLAAQSPPTRLGPHAGVASKTDVGVASRPRRERAAPGFAVVCAVRHLS